MSTARRSVNVLVTAMSGGTPKPNMISGTPLESDLPLFEDGDTEFDIWEVMPGSFRRGRTESASKSALE